MKGTNYSYKQIDTVRSDLIGKSFEIVDIEEKGSLIHLKDRDGCKYMFDTTSSNAGVIVHAGANHEESIEFLQKTVNAMMVKLGINMDELLDTMCD